MPLTSPTASIAAVRSRIQDQSATNPVLGDTEIDTAIQQAVLSEYSRHRQLVLAIELAGDGPLIPLSDLTGYVDGFSTLSQVEYPATAEEDYATEELGPILDASHDYTLHRGASGWYLRLIGYSPAATELVRVSYTVPRSHTAEASTVLATDLEAVLDLSASIACLYAATKTAHAVDDTIGSDGVNRGSASSRYLRAAESWRDRYMQHMGLGKYKETTPYGIWHDFDTQSSFESTGRRWLTHGRGWAVR